jgi:hypothetical protein
MHSAHVVQDNEVSQHYHSPHGWINTCKAIICIIIH